jgi:hypothetical protein
MQDSSKILLLNSFQNLQIIQANTTNKNKNSL